MLWVGLTGGIGAGKSAVAGMLAELGAVVIDADRMAREVVEPGTPGLTAVVDAFGRELLRTDDALHRARLAELVFADPAARQRLDGIVHPLVAARTAELIAAAPADAVVVYDVPLLVEAGLAADFHLVVVVEAPPEVRVARLARDRGMAEPAVRARLAAQASDAGRRAVADVVLHNGGSLDALRPAVAGLWRDRLLPYEANRRAGRVAAATASTVPVASDPSWPVQYERLAARIRRACGEAAQRVDHIGPTALAGQPARDVIDLQVAVSPGAADRVRSGLADAGFPALDGKTHGSADPGRPALVHLRPADSADWRAKLARA